MSRKTMIQKSQKLDKQIKEIRKELKKFPEGNFFCCHTGKYHQWFFKKDKKQVYIPKRNRELAEQLALKRYLSDLESDLTQEKAGIDAYLTYHTSDTRKSDQLLLDPAYQELLSPHFKSLNQELQEWMHEPYDKNPQHPEHLLHKTISGNIVRSKSEVLIDMALYKNHIPFRYESPLQLGQSIYYPDFTIRHPKTGKIYYWEHLGMMDNPSYSQKAYQKLQVFTSNGIIPFQQLIITFETQDHPLDSQLVEKIIEYFFL